MLASGLECHSFRVIEPQSTVARCSHPRLRADRREISLGVCEICDLRKQTPPDRFFEKPGQSSRLVDRGNVQIVVARYKEDVTWVEAFHDFDVVVYDKGDPHAVNSLSNVGREAHTYLHHILENYDSLSETTVFLQGQPFDHCGPMLSQRIWELHNDVDFIDLCLLALPEDQTGGPTQPGLPLAEEYRNLFDEEPPEFFLCRVGACFAVSRERIRSRSTAFYRKLLKLAVEHPLGPWLLERFWWKVFSGPNSSAGIVTASTESFFDDLQLMLKSLQIHSKFPITVFDLGLTRMQRHWIEDLPNVTVQQPAWECTYLTRILHLPDWPLWTKPFLMYASPYRKTVWIDGDCTIVAPIDDLFAELDDHPVIVRDQTSVETDNTHAFYQWLPLSPDSDGPQPAAPNSGVVGLELQRDMELLAAWTWAAGMVARNPKWAKEVAWCDQGLLLWALRRLSLTSLVRTSTTWNQASFEVCGLITEAVDSRCSMLDVIRSRFPSSAIVHWLGCFKLSGQLRKEMDSLIFKGFDAPLAAECTSEIRPLHNAQPSRFVPQPESKHAR